jgi:beta-glucosidase
MEMVSTAFYDNLEALLSKKLVSMDDLNTKVANCLRIKLKMNLFENYYTDPSRQSIILDPKHKEAAKVQATQCPVLLQNKNKTLPISKTIGTLAVIGSLANDPDNQIGCWAPDGKPQDSITPLTTLKATLTSTKIVYAQGYKDTRSTDTSFFNEAISAASTADKVLLFLGEDNNLSGESHSRAYINLPGVQ